MWWWCRLHLTVWWTRLPPWRCPGFGQSPVGGCLVDLCVPAEQADGVGDGLYTLHQSTRHRAGPCWAHSGAAVWVGARATVLQAKVSVGMRSTLILVLVYGGVWWVGGGVWWVGVWWVVFCGGSGVEGCPNTCVIPCGLCSESDDEDLARVADASCTGVGSVTRLCMTLLQVRRPRWCCLQLPNPFSASAASV